MTSCAHFLLPFYPGGWGRGSQGNDPCAYFLPSAWKGSGEVHALKTCLARAAQDSPAWPRAHAALAHYEVECSVVSAPPPSSPFRAWLGGREGKGWLGGREGGKRRDGMSFGGSRDPEIGGWPQGEAQGAR